MGEQGLFVGILGGIRSRALTLAKPIHTSFRFQKLKLFEALVGKPHECSLLDVGGGLGLFGEFTQLYSSFANVTVVNILSHRMELPAGSKTGYRVVADGCMLPFCARAFDWVFSNAVIEHVGDWERQNTFAREIRRVARIGYFVATPNKYFPVEPHTYLPFYQFLPQPWQRRAVRLAPGYMREYEEINLLSAKNVRVLFPEARVSHLGFPVLGNNLVAYYKASSV